MGDNNRALIVFAMLGLVGLFLVGTGSPAEAAPSTHRVHGSYSLGSADGDVGAATVNLTCSFICTGSLRVDYTGYKYSDGFTGSFIGWGSITPTPGGGRFFMRGLAFGSHSCFTYGGSAEPCHVPNPALMIGSAQLACDSISAEAWGQGVAFAFPPGAWFGGGSMPPCDTSDLTFT